MKKNIQYMRNSGYSMPDVLIALTIIIILSTIVYPHVSSYLNTQKEREEMTVQAEIVKALGIQAVETGRLPNENANHHIDAASDDIADYSNMSKEEIETDAWDNINPRYYRQLTVTRAYRDVEVPIHYAFVLSLGERGCWGTGTVTDGCDAATIDASVTNLLQTEDDFQTLRAAEGDVLTKYSDIELRTEQYEVTRKRMDAIVNALKEFATIKRYEGIANGDGSASGDVSYFIYYPPSEKGYDANIYKFSAPTNNRFANELTAGSGKVSVDDDDDRLEDMKGLMRIIGLPEEYCCSPLKKITVNGERVEFPFYYYSNPGVLKADGTCVNPATAENERKLPALITLVPITCS